MSGWWQTKFNVSSRLRSQSKSLREPERAWPEPELDNTKGEVYKKDGLDPIDPQLNLDLECHQNWQVQVPSPSPARLNLQVKSKIAKFNFRLWPWAQVFFFTLLSSPFPKPPMHHPKQVPINSQTQLIPRGLELTLKCCRPSHTSHTTNNF